MAIEVQALRRIRVGEDDVLAVDCRRGLNPNEVITSVGGVSASPSGLTVGSPQTNSGSITIDGESVPAGKALLCSITDGVAGAIYEVVFTLTTNEATTVMTTGIMVQAFA